MFCIGTVSTELEDSHEERFGNMASSATPDDWVVVKTSLPALPLPLSVARPIVTTERLILRPLVPEDLEQIHDLRTQPEVMRWTKAGRIDLDLAESEAKLAAFLPPNDSKTHNCAICLKDGGKIIGLGGMHQISGEFGWPELGYMLRRECWGKGFATEFVRGFLRAWDALPRSEVDLKVKSLSVAGEGDVVEERLVASIEEVNARSSNILNKCGFEKFLDWGNADWRDPTEQIALASYRYFPGRAGRG